METMEMPKSREREERLKADGWGNGRTKDRSTERGWKGRGREEEEENMKKWEIVGGRRKQGWKNDDAARTRGILVAMTPSWLLTLAPISSQEYPFLYFISERFSIYKTENIFQLSTLNS